jgi:hypothetical protein
VTVPASLRQSGDQRGLAAALESYYACFHGAFLLLWGDSQCNPVTLALPPWQNGLEI